MNTVIWIIYTAVSLAAIIFLSLREFHMLQLNGYKTPEHSRWMKKNFRRYIFPLVLLIAQFGLIPLTGGGRTALLITLCVMDLFIILANKPGKKFKKPLVYTARVKRMMTTDIPGTSSPSKKFFGAGFSRRYPFCLFLGRMYGFLPCFSTFCLLTFYRRTPSENKKSRFV